MDVFKQISESIDKVGVIYSKHEGEYSIILYQNNDSEPLSSSSGKLKLFKSLEQAKSALKSQKIKQAYLALDNVYDEFDELPLEKHMSDINTRYDYVPIELG